MHMPVKPTDKEEEFFAREELKRLKKAEEEKQSQIQQQERNRLKELHYMRCPKCGMELIEIDYKGITIDRCSECDGVWLDAGELEALAKMEKSGLDKFFSIFK
jgi:hypothetical protein